MLHHFLGRYSRRLEAISLSLPNQPEAGGISYEVHAKGTGWMPAKADGAVAGTTGESRRLEAVKVSLTGEMKGDFSVWYRVHSQTYGWLGWAHDGEVAGTTGMSKRANTFLARPPVASGLVDEIHAVMPRLAAAGCCKGLI